MNSEWKKKRGREGERREARSWCGFFCVVYHISHFNLTMPENEQYTPQNIRCQIRENAMCNKIISPILIP